jgi:uncharacterized membrane protein YsdA (DUF1294 family)
MAVGYMESSLRLGAFIGAAWCAFATLLLVASQAASLSITWTTFALLVASLLLSGITFLLFAYDKRQAQREAWRIQEFTLHMFTLLGGWAGAFLAQRWLRHKSQKFMFQTTAWCGLAIHLLALFVWWGWR